MELPDEVTTVTLEIDNVELPFRISEVELTTGKLIGNVIKRMQDLVSSTSEALRMIKQGAVKIRWRKN